MTEYREKVIMLPDHMQASVLRYIEQGEPVGGFLSAVLSNNLNAAFTYVNDRDPKLALRAAQVSAVMQGGVVMLNLRVVF